VRSRGTITIEDLPADIEAPRGAVVAAPTGAGIPAGAHAVAAQPSRATRESIEDVLDRMVKRRESFWAAVYPAFMNRDLTRTELRSIVKRGLETTGGSYKMLVDLLNMPPSDYKRFLGFLRKHDCHVPFARFRSAEFRRSDSLRDSTAGRR
jgi:hypothetical protein